MFFLEYLGSGGPSKTRTCDLTIMSRVLYQLSYRANVSASCHSKKLSRRILWSGTPRRIRTFDKRLRRALLYPTELPAHCGQDGEIRTPDLPLRRGPLYPTELRPDKSLCVSE